MSATRPLASGDSSVILLDPGRRTRPLARSSRIAAASAILTLCLFGLIGSFADSALARTGLLLADASDEVGNFDDLAAVLIWATIANLAICAGVVMATYWLLSRPSAQIVELRSRRPKL
jgi:hypothetical protein